MPIEYMNRRPIKIAITSYKGGVAKTTTTAAIANCLSRQNKTVLAIDMDGQGDLTAAFQVNAEAHDTTYDAILQPHNTWPAVYVGNQMSITPSSPKMETLLFDIRELEYLPDIVERMHHKIEYIKGYDYVMFDCPPSLNDITRAAITVSDYVIIPAIPTPMSLNALVRTVEYVELIGQKKNKPSILGIVDTMCESLHLHAEAISAIEDAFPGLQFRTKIPRTVEMQKMILRGYSRDPLTRNKGFAAYDELTSEILNRINNNKQF